MRKFNIKNLKKVNTIIKQEIAQDFAANILKIDQKKYIQDILKSKKMILYNSTIFPVKTSSTFFLNQISNYQQANLTTY